MAVKVLIKRQIPVDKAREMIPLFKQMRIQANNQPGYISGETLRNVGDPEDYVVISTWQSEEVWKAWASSKDRTQIQEKIDALLGGTTDYGIYFYG